MNERMDDDMNVAPDGLEALRLQAPSDSLDRFRKRASLLTGARYVLERQVYGFWIVLNTLLRLLFKQVNVPVQPADGQQASRYRRASRNSSGGTR